MKPALALVGLALLLAACTAGSTSAPTQLPVPVTPAASLTPSIVWFPPTPTFTPFPTLPLPPTTDLRPGLGEVLLAESFSADSPWSLGTTQAGSAAFGKAELSIVVKEKRTYIYAVRSEPVFTDFYLEVEANPNLCRDQDEYGVLFRYQSSGDFYRFAANCAGEVRLDRLAGGEAAAVQPWTQTGAVPRGAPSFARLGIWVQGQEMRFFAGDVHLFTARDPLLDSGQIGFFARSASDELLSVNFSKLTVWSVSP